MSAGQKWELNAGQPHGPSHPAEVWQSYLPLSNWV